MSDEYSLTTKWQRGEIGDGEYRERMARLGYTPDDDDLCACCGSLTDNPGENCSACRDSGLRE